MTKKRDYVKIASFLFIDEYKKERGKTVPGVIYNKFITLLYRDIKQEKDIGLPHCWYRWGDIVVKNNVPYISWDHRNLRYTTVEWKDDVPEIDNNDRVISLIKKNIAEFLIRHTGSEAHETAKDEVYEGAPFEFQNEYRKLREALDPNNKKVSIGNQNEYYASLFENAMDKFPTKEFKQISDEKEKFEAVFRAGLRNEKDSCDLFDLAELFWFFFCYHLRLNKKGHENVLKETLSIWAEKIPWETMKFGHILQNYAAKFTDGTDDDQLIISLLADREHRMKDIDTLLSDLDDDR